MKTLNIITQPYDDEMLVYNAETGRYELTLAEVKTLVDAMPFKNDNIVKRRIKENSRVCYNYLINHSNTANRQVINFMINKTEEGRKFIHDLLVAQMESDSIGRMPTVNVQSGQVMDRYTIRENQLCLNAENVIDDSNNYFGFNICYMLPYPSGIFLYVYNNEKRD